MDRQAFFTTQIVSSDDLGRLEDAIEAAMARVQADQFQFCKGILAGLDIGLLGTLSVTITPGVAYDGTALSTSGGVQRIAVPALQTVNLGIASAGGSTIPTVAGQKIAVLLVAQFARNEYQDRTQQDGSSAPYRWDESFQLAVLASAPGTSPAYPTPAAGQVVLMGCLMSVGQTVVAATNLDYAQRMEGFWQGGPAGVALPLAIGEAVQAVAGVTYGNLQVTPILNTNTVRVNQGWVNGGNSALRLAAPAYFDLTTLGAGLTCIALLYLDLSGVPQAVFGAAVGSSPVAPDHSIGYPLAEVTLRGSGLSSPPYLLSGDVADVRPFLARPVPQAVRRRHEATGDGTTTVFTMPWSYVVGGTSLNVFDNGALDAAAAYTETDSTHVTFAVAPTSGHVLVFEADIPLGALTTVPHAATHRAGGSDPIDLGFADVDGFVETVERSLWANPTVQNGFATAVTAGRVRAIIGGQPLKNTATTALTLPTLTANSTYFVYGHNNGDGTIAFEVTTVAPDGTNLYKTGDATRLFLGSFMTDNGAEIYPFEKRGRHVRLMGYSVVGPTTFGLGGTGPAYGLPRTTTNNTGGGAGTRMTWSHIPGTARIARTEFTYTGSASQLIIQAYDQTDAFSSDVGIWNGTTSDVIDIPLSTSQTFMVVGDTNTTRFVLLGYQE